MSLSESYVLKKEVDWSLLNEGLTIPMANQIVFTRNMGRFLVRGEKKKINILLNGMTYKAVVTNVNFNVTKYKRKDIIQLRYSPSSELAIALRDAYAKSYKYLIEQRTMRKNNKENTHCKLPEEGKEYLAIYTTQYEDTFIFETINSAEMRTIKSIVVKEQEEIYEATINFNTVDRNASILLDERVTKVRKLSQAIGENLKEIYNYRCQICGQNIGDKYDTHIVEAHHIDYFVKSLNNDASNQLIVCPNHHSIIHKANATFVRNKKVFIYQNGFQEALQLNVHL